MTSGMMNTLDGYPTLCCKAFNGRLLLIFLDRCIHALAATAAPCPEVYNACVAARCMTAWFDRLERSPRFLDQNAKAELYSFGTKYVQTVERLAIISLMNGTSRWRLQPKLHAYQHINEDYHLKFGYNARFVHCYIDEDFVGLTKRLAVRVHRGELMEWRILCRWLLRLSSWIPGEHAQ